MNDDCSKAAGFTLIELVVVMAIASMILILSASVLKHAGEAYERVSSQVNVEREARSVMSQLARDLATAEFHVGTRFEKSSAVWSRDRLGFLNLQPVAAQSESGRVGDLCAVSYFCKDRVVGGKVERCLMRGFRESRETFAAVKSKDLASLFLELPARDEPVAFGVVSFEARPKSRDVSGKWRDWEMGESRGPEALELKLVLAHAALQARLRLSEDWDGNQLLGEPSVVEHHSKLSVYRSTHFFGTHGSF